MASKTMMLVNDQAGEFLRAADRSEVPESFLAALTANESLGDPKAKRHEPGVEAKLVRVCLGQRKSYNGVTAGMLWVEPRQGESREKFAFHQLEHLQDAATSWGFTQIMGYHMLRWEREIAELTDPERHYNFTLRLLRECPNDALQKHGTPKIDLSKNFEKMARWWNTGNPHGETYHKDYVPNILRRMTQWAQM